MAGSPLLAGPGAALPTLPASVRRLRTVRDPFTLRRLLGFLGLHFLAFFAEVSAMLSFIFTKDTYFFVFTLMPFLFSGAFCAHAAWNCGALCSGWGVLPLRDWPLPLALLLLLPLGFLQGVIVLLALEEYKVRRDGLVEPEPECASQAMKTSSNKYHCKAVNGLFEGLLSSAVLLYAYWTLGFPSANPITTQMYPKENIVIGSLGFISMLSSGLGLLELDFCTSRTISRRMRRSTRYEAIHWLFRSSEVCCRISVMICFMVTTRRTLGWWYVPLAVDFTLTTLLVAFHGGAEGTWLVWLLCSIPCTFANIFMFIDSPYKRGAAVRLSWWLTLKNALELMLLPFLVYIAAQKSDQFSKELKENWDKHSVMFVGGGISIPLYWTLLWWVSSSTIHRNNIVDLYVPCEQGDLAAVRSAMRELTRSAAVGLDVNRPDINGNTPLMLAAANGHAKICKLLLQEGARVDVRRFGDGRIWSRMLSKSVRRKWTALHIAAWHGQKEVVQVLAEEITRVAAEPMISVSVLMGEGFRDERGDTPLHVAARAGHVEVIRILSAFKPAWRDVLNNRHQRPLDLAQSEELQRVIANPGPVEGTRSPLLTRRTELPTAEGGPGPVGQAWPKVQLSILRTSREEHLMAPGLCSYIASSCGGALGRIFLTDTPSVNGFDAGGSALTSISEVDEGESSVGRTPNVANTPSAPGGSELAALNRPLPIIEDLVAIDKNGTPIRWWVDMVQQSQVRPGAAGATSSGRHLAQVPPEAELGSGSYGLVWRAKDKSTGKWYAVKTITRPGTQSVALRECEVADHIRLMPHPCLVHLFHVHNFTDANLYVLVMEFCPGGDLLGVIQRQRIEARRAGRIYNAPEKAVEWVGQIFLGLEHMHRRMDTLLRDLKPENVVLSTEGRAKLTDFGFGRFGVESSGRWSFGIPTGSPGYVAPEVLLQEEYDFRADLYSLGVLVWVMLTGGLSSARMPQPPVGTGRRDQGFAAHFQDWYRLKQCIEDPVSHDAIPLQGDALDFVTRLTQRTPGSRMRHDDIRAHDFLQHLSLPDYKAPPCAVEEWLTRPPLPPDEKGEATLQTGAGSQTSGA